MEQKNAPIKERIMYFLDSQNIKKADFFRLTGISPSGFKGKGLESEIGGDNLTKFVSAYPQINLRWLLLGELPMIREGSNIPVIQINETIGFQNGVFNVHNHLVLDYLSNAEFSGKGIEFVTEITGDAMSPVYNHGDRLCCKVIDPSGFIQWNMPHIIITASQGTVYRKIRKSNEVDSLLLVAENPDYESFDIPKSEITGIALIIGILR